MLAVPRYKVPETIKGFRRDKLSGLRPVGEFLDHQRISRPQDMNEATQVSHPRPPLPLGLAEASVAARWLTHTCSSILLHSPHASSCDLANGAHLPG